MSQKWSEIVTLATPALAFLLNVIIRQIVPDAQPIWEFAYCA